MCQEPVKVGIEHLALLTGKRRRARAIDYVIAIVESIDPKKLSSTGNVIDRNGSGRSAVNGNTAAVVSETIVGWRIQSGARSGT